MLSKYEQQILDLEEFHTGTPVYNQYPANNGHQQAFQYYAGGQGQPATFGYHVANGGNSHYVQQNVRWNNEPYQIEKRY